MAAGRPFGTLFLGRRPGADRGALGGIAAIRAWRSEVPRVEYAITDVEPAGEGLVVTCTITGDFPGSPFAGLRFRFEDLDDDHVRVLRIGP